VNGKHDPASEPYRKRNKAKIVRMLKACRSLAAKFPKTRAGRNAQALIQAFSPKNTEGATP
jgi:hypothetical protein